MAQTAAKSEREISAPPDLAGPVPDQGVPTEDGFAPSPERWVGMLRLLWNARRLVFRWTVAGLAAATLLAFLVPREYQSTTRLMPPDAQSLSGATMLASLAARSGNGVTGFAGDLLGLKSSGALFVGVLQSHTIRERLVQRFDLRKVYGAKLMLDAENQLAKNTSVSEDRKSGIITITGTDHSPQRAAAITNGYVEELDRLVSELSTSAAHRERVFLEERLKAVKQDLDDAAEKFGKFASKNTAIDIQSQGRAMVDAAARLQGELIAAQSESEMLKQIYTENNVRVRAARARISELQRQLEKMGGAPAQAASNGGQAADPFYPSIRELPLLGITYTDLSRRAKIEEAVYEILTQQYELAKVQEAKETPSVKVLDRGEVPERKSSPSRMLIMLLGTLFSFALATLYVWGSARWRETDPQDPRKVLAQEIYANVREQIPWAAKNGSRVHAATRTLWERFRRRESPPDKVK